MFCMINKVNNSALFNHKQIKTLNFSSFIYTSLFIHFFKLIIYLTFHLTIHLIIDLLLHTLNYYNFEPLHHLTNFTFILFHLKGVWGFQGPFQME